MKEGRSFVFEGCAGCKPLTLHRRQSQGLGFRDRVEGAHSLNSTIRIFGVVCACEGGGGGGGALAPKPLTLNLKGELTLNPKPPTARYPAATDRKVSTLRRVSCNSVSTRSVSLAIAVGEISVRV